MSQSNTKWIPSLDGIRAASIMMVIAAHAIATKDFPQRLGRRMAFVVTGHLGVLVFFVISGYLITTLLLAEERKSGAISLRLFYVRWAIRIWPVYFFYIFVIVALDRGPGFSVPAPHTIISAATFTTCLWGNWNSASCWPLIHSWSLSVEEQFYLLWPLVLWLTKKGRYWAGGTILLLTLVARALWYYSAENHNILLPKWSLTFPTNADSIMCGCLLALLHANHLDSLTKMFNFKSAFFRLFALCLIYILGWLLKGGVDYTLMPLIASLAATYLIGSYVIVRQGWTYALLNLPLVRWVGRLSYSLYMWQQPFLWPAPNDGGQSWFQEFPQNIVCVFIVSALSYYCIERQFLRLKARFSH